MNDLLPILPQQLNQVLGSLPYFIPELYLTALFILVLITDLLFGRNSEKLCRIVAISGLLFVIFRDLQQFQLAGNEVRFLFGRMLVFHHTVVVFKLIIDIISVTLLLYFGWDDDLKAHKKGLSDLYSIAIATIFGLHLMVMAVNLLSIYLSVEIVSIASYLLVAYRAENSISSEAGLKYVLFGGASSAIMLYGISLLYGFGGSLNLFYGTLVPGLLQADHTAVAFALLLVMAGIGFKLSFIPMHFWVPDIYQGAATSVTAFLSTLPKIAAFSLLINFLTPFIFLPQWSAFDFRLFLSVVGIVTMVAGNFAATLQANIKRMLAYSSIGHTGFALMAVVTFSQQGSQALLFYLVAYAIANIGALMLASYFSNIANAENLDDYKGLGLKYPLAGVSFVIILISLAGLPVTAGFNGKLLVFSTAYDTYKQGHNSLFLILMITGAVTTVVSLFYYIKIPLNLFLRKPELPATAVNVNPALVVFALIISVLLLLLGLFPSPLMKIF